MEEVGVGYRCGVFKGNFMIYLMYYFILCLGQFREIPEDGGRKTDPVYPEPIVTKIRFRLMDTLLSTDISILVVSRSIYRRR